MLPSADKTLLFRKIFKMHSSYIPYLTKHFFLVSKISVEKLL